MTERVRMVVAGADDGAVEFWRCLLADLSQPQVAGCCCAALVPLAGYRSGLASRRGLCADVAAMLLAGWSMVRWAVRVGRSWAGRRVDARGGVVWLRRCAMGG